ncbi:3182_t:CDS:2, partial [Acaulospora colombiana]
AGSQHTPQVLLLSGIGDKKLLDSLGIKVVSDLPGVGQNFQDHPGATPNATFLNDLNPNPGNVTNSTWLAEQRVLYDNEKKGVWTTSAANSAAFLPFHLFTNRVTEQHKLLIKGAHAANIAFAEYANGGSAATPL